MTATLTCEAGRHPGAAGRRPLARKPPPAMNEAQRSALSELVHGPCGSVRSPLESRRPRAELMWFAVLALVFVLSGRALFEGVRFVHTADALHATKVAEPQVDVTITRVPAQTEAMSAASLRHSSVTASRTM